MEHYSNTQIKVTRYTEVGWIRMARVVHWQNTANSDNPSVFHWSRIFFNFVSND
jgi:hypothetical protein